MVIRHCRRSRGPFSLTRVVFSVGSLSVWPDIRRVSGVHPRCRKAGRSTAHKRDNTLTRWKWGSHYFCVFKRPVG